MAPMATRDEMESSACWRRHCRWAAAVAGLLVVAAAVLYGAEWRDFVNLQGQVTRNQEARIAALSAVEDRLRSLEIGMARSEVLLTEVKATTHRIEVKVDSAASTAADKAKGG